MPTKPNESPPPEQDRDPDPDRSPPDQVRNIVTASQQPARNQDAAQADDFDGTDDPDINTHGSER
jgi:hypothetical protein